MAENIVQLPADSSGKLVAHSHTSHTHTIPLTATWTSTVASTSSSSTMPTGTPNPYYQQVPQPFGPYQTSSGSGVAPNVYVSTPQQPSEGMIAHINGKLYRYTEAGNIWHEVVDAPTSEQVEAPALPIELDAESMLDALRQYRDFLDELDGLDQRYANAVDDTLFGLNEAIEALETLEQA